MRVLLAFDKFKDALGSQEACAAAARALTSVRPDWQLDLCPLSDGGEGFCAVLTRALGGELGTIEVAGPRGARVAATIGFVSATRIPAAALAALALPRAAQPETSPRRLAIIEMAAASGLALLPPEQRDVWQTTTLGTGESIRAASRRGAAAILLGIGGSATNDLGLGALSALGLEFRSAANGLVHPPVPARWDEIVRISGAVARDLPSLRIACDVQNPLLGPRGAAAVYGPQKGLRAEDRPRLEHAAARLALLLCHHCGQPDALMDAPGSGAAGGISFGLVAAAGARLLSGFELVGAWLDLERRIAAADIVVTGEGRFDASSLEGKGPGAIAARALALGKRVHVFAGQTALAPPPGLAVHAITPPGAALGVALRDTEQNLAHAVATAFRPE